MISTNEANQNKGKKKDLSERIPGRSPEWKGRAISIEERTKYNSLSDSLVSLTYTFSYQLTSSLHQFLPVILTLLSPPFSTGKWVEFHSS